MYATIWNIKEEVGRVKVGSGHQLGSEVKKGSFWPFLGLSGCHGNNTYRPKYIRLASSRMGLSFLNLALWKWCICVTLLSAMGFMSFMAGKQHIWYFYLWLGDSIQKKKFTTIFYPVCHMHQPWLLWHVIGFCP